MSIGVVVTQIGMLFLMIAVGFVAGKKHVIKDESSAEVTSLLMKVIVPFMLLGANLRKYEANLMKDAMLAIVISTVFFAVSMVINHFLTKLLKLKKEKAPIWNISASFSNTGFVGFPVCQALYGDEGLFIAAMINMVFNIYVYTIGAIMVVRASGSKEKPSTAKMIFSNINIATFVGLIFLFLQIPFPGIYDVLGTEAGNVFVKTVNTIGAATTPLSMLLIGLNMAKGRISETVTDKDVLSATFVRLVLAPLFALLCMILIFGPKGSGEDFLVRSVFPLIIAMPAPSVGVILTEMYGGEKVYASRVATLSSLICMVTIPLFAMLL